MLSGESANSRKILTPLQLYVDGWLASSLRRFAGFALRLTSKKQLWLGRPESVNPQDSLDLLSGESANWRKNLTPLRFYADGWLAGWLAGWLVATARSSKCLGISTSDSESRRIFQHFPRSTRFINLCTASNSKFADFFANFANFSEFSRFLQTCAEIR